MLEHLKTLEGSALDVQYVDDTIKSHSLLITILDTIAIPGAKSDDFRGELTEHRREAVEHLDYAKETKAKLEGS